MCSIIMCFLYMHALSDLQATYSGFVCINWSFLDHYLERVSV